MAWACRSKFGGAAEIRPSESGFGGVCRAVLRMRLQLRNAIGERKAFEHFKEAELTHLPYVFDAYLLGDTVPTAI